MDDDSNLKRIQELNDAVNSIEWDDKVSSTYIINWDDSDDDDSSDQSKYQKSDKMTDNSSDNNNIQESNNNNEVDAIISNEEDDNNNLSYIETDVNNSSIKIITSGCVSLQITSEMLQKWNSDIENKEEED